MTPHLRQRAPASLDCLVGDAFRSARVGQVAARRLKSVGSGPGHRRPARHDRAPGLTGSRRVKVDPEPSLLVTVTFPPCAAVTCLTIASPRPVPPVTRDLAGSTRVSGSKLPVKSRFR